MAAVNQTVGPGRLVVADNRGRRLVVKSIPLRMGRKSRVMVISGILPWGWYDRFMHPVVYVCTGGCGERVTEDEYLAGGTTCRQGGCAHQGQMLERRYVCNECGHEYKEEEKHEHS